MGIGVWGAFDVVATKAIKGSFGARAIFLKIPFPKHYLYNYDTFTDKLFVSIPCDSPHKSYFLAFKYQKYL